MLRPVFSISATNRFQKSQERFGCLQKRSVGGAADNEVMPLPKIGKGQAADIIRIDKRVIASVGDRDRHP